MKSEKLFKNNNGDTHLDTDIQVGDFVKVKNEIMCPDMEGLCIGGWKGKVIEITEGLVCIEWDDITIENMPNYFIEQSDDEGLEYRLMYLYMNEVEKAT